MANSVEITVTGKNEASRVFKEVDNDAKSLSGRMKSTLGNVSQVAGGVLLAGGLQAGGEKLLSFANNSIDAAKDSRAANAQLEQVLKSTGGAAGLTAGELKKMASAMEKVSLFEDEAVIKAQSLLLTFTNIGKDVFPGATQTVLDMSQALGQDLSSSSIQLGKALNDPVSGISALTRVGVSFTDQQKEQIKTMAESGDVAGAQKLILEELNKEFGGQAKAASDAAGASERQKDRMNELNEVIGEKLLPIQEKWKEAQIIALNFMISKVIPTLEALYQEYWPGIEKVLREKVIPIIQALTPVFKFMAENIVEKMQGAAQAIGGFIEIITRVVNTVSAIIHGDWARAWNQFKGIPEAILNVLEGMFRYWLGKLPELFYNAGKEAGEALWDGIKKGAGKVADLVPGLDLPGIGQINPLKRASGGPVSAGRPYIVGERGPELFMPRSGGQIISNSEMSKVTKRIRDAAMALWPGNRRFQQGELRSAMEGLSGFKSGRRVAPEWMQTYGRFLPRRAGGGLVAAGQPYIVGEQGSELFLPRSGGQTGLSNAAGARSHFGGEPGMAVTIRGDVIVNNNGVKQDADGAIRALGYMIRTQARSRGASLAV